jgi:hypothetical protein
MDNTELKDFALGEMVDSKDYVVVDSTENLENFDFSSDTPFDIETSYELVENMKKEEDSDEVKELIKLREAKNIIDRDAKIFLDPVFVDKFSKEEENLLNLIKKFDANKDEVRNMTEEQKDKIYEIAQYLFNAYQKKLNDLTFSFPLTKDEIKFVYNVFRNKLEYDQNEVFQLKDVKENYLDKEFDKDEKGNAVTYINVNDLIIFYHLISKYKVKGITQEHYDFLQVLTKIGERIKLFNAYNVVVQRLSNDFQLWGSTLSVEGELVGTAMEPTMEKFNDINSSEPLSIIKETGEVVK